MSVLPVDRSQRVLTSGAPVPDDNSHTEDRGDGQQKGYVILTPAERAKGFVRPVRQSYRHVGPPAPANLRDLTPEEREQYDKYAYVKYESYELPRGSVVGKFWTQRDLDRLGKGCGQTTTMATSIAETFARDPGFYSGGFCCTCGAHFPNAEFVWDGTDERVGT